MTSCVRCGKELGLRRFFTDQGVMCREDYHIWRDEKKKQKEESKEFKRKQEELEKHHSGEALCLANPEALTYPWGDSLTFLPQEIGKQVKWFKASELYDHVLMRSNLEVGQSGYLILTCRRLLFVGKQAMSNYYALTYASNIEDLVAISPGRLGLNKKVVVLDSKGVTKQFVEPNIHNSIATFNEIKMQRLSEIEDEKKQQSKQIVEIVDFTSLKQVMAKGGIALTSYKCPQCAAPLTIPESGEVLTCQYCGSKVKPVDVFEKLNALL